MERGVPREARQRLQPPLTGRRERRLGRDKAILGSSGPAATGAQGTGRVTDLLRPG